MAELAACTSVWLFLAAMEQESLCCGAGKTVSMLVDHCRAIKTHPTTSSHPSVPVKHISQAKFGVFRHESPSDQHAYILQCVPRTAAYTCKL
jgi:cellobiose-specific phosphotransferase system component IIB